MGRIIAVSFPLPRSSGRLFQINGGCSSTEGRQGGFICHRPTLVEVVNTPDLE